MWRCLLPGCDIYGKPQRGHHTEAHQHYMETHYQRPEEKA